MAAYEELVALADVLRNADVNADLEFVYSAESGLRQAHNGDVLEVRTPTEIWDDGISIVGGRVRVNLRLRVD